jgi:hypothetical protein
MHYFAFLTTLLASLTLTIAAPSPQISDIPSLLSGLVGNTEPPLMTTVHSPECKNLNDGTAMCCDAQLDGGNPLVQSLAALMASHVRSLFRLCVNSILELEY